MRKILLISLLSIHLLGNTEIGQLFRLPQLVSHFLQHHRQDPSISFFDFIAFHYTGDDGTTADDDVDSKLPFHNSSHNTVSVVYAPMVNPIFTSGFLSWETTEYPNQMQTGTGAKHVQLVLQPPRTA